MIMSTPISREQLQEKLASLEPPILVEALPAKYYLDGHLPGAIHLPHDRVRQMAATLLPDKQAEIITYCASDTCSNSHVAAQTLVALGYTNVAVFGGGKRDWVEAGLALEKGGRTAEAA
jgi:rhodanese-related sulfurtransferase